MTARTENRLTLSAAFVVPFAAAAWWLFSAAAPAVASTSVVIALLVIALAVGLNWANGQPTGGVAQVIYEAHRTPHPGNPVFSPIDIATASRWDAWQARADALAHTGRVRAILAFSIAATSALLFYEWIM